MRNPAIAAALVLSFFMSAPAFAQDAVSLVGTWKGPRERVHATQANRADTATMIISEQNGMTFRGVMKWSAPEGEQSDPFVGAFPSGQGMGAGAAKDGPIVFELENPTTINYCYSETGGAFLTACGHLTKQP